MVVNTQVINPSRGYSLQITYHLSMVKGQKPSPDFRDLWSMDLDTNYSLSFNLDTFSQMSPILAYNLIK